MDEGEVVEGLKPCEPHWHVDKDTGIVHRCFHQCKLLLTNWQFWVGLTIGYPFEHFLWEKVPPFSYIAQYLGLIQ